MNFIDTSLTDSNTIAIFPTFKKVHYRRFVNKAASCANDQNVNPNEGKLMASHYHLPTFGNLKKELFAQMVKTPEFSMQKKPKTAPTRSPSWQRPRFPRNNKIIKQFLFHRPSQDRSRPSIVEHHHLSHNSIQESPLKKLPEYSSNKILAKNIDNSFKKEPEQTDLKAAKSLFRKLYMKQKKRCQSLLRKHGIHQEIDDRQLSEFFQSY